MGGSSRVNPHRRAGVEGENRPRWQVFRPQVSFPPWDAPEGPPPLQHPSPVEVAGGGDRRPRAERLCAQDQTGSRLTCARSVAPSDRSQTHPSRKPGWEPPRFRIGRCIGGDRGLSATRGNPWHERGGRQRSTLSGQDLQPWDRNEDGLPLQAQPRRAASCAVTRYWLALLGLRLARPAATQACLARSPPAFDRRSSSEHLLGMLVVWPVCLATYPTERGEMCRHRSPACGRRHSATCFPPGVARVVRYRSI